MGLEKVVLGEGHKTGSKSLLPKSPAGARSGRESKLGDRGSTFVIRKQRNRKNPGDPLTIVYARYRQG